LQTKKTILICPLEWGLGHAGRMVPLAKNLIDLGHNVIIGSGPGHLEFFRKELPEIKCIDFPGYSIRYSSWLPQYLVILLNVPVFLISILKEHRQLKRIIAGSGIDIVISDSRPGLWNTSIKTVFVTHMIRVPLPGWASLIKMTGLITTKRIIKRFNFCFIPDVDSGNDLSGKLSHGIKLPGNARYIGILSRFPVMEKAAGEGDYDFFCTVLLSGPEPQRSLLKKKLERILRLKNEKSVILEGRPESKPEKRSEGNLTYISHLSPREMTDLIYRSRHIISRSGYTTLMELTALGKSAIIIPTPGQTEQEYLAGYLSQKGWFRSISQKEINCEMFHTGKEYAIPVNLNKISEKLLKSALGELLE
jgi:hypothetical protein